MLAVGVGRQICILVLCRSEVQKPPGHAVIRAGQVSFQLHLAAAVCS